MSQSINIRLAGPEDAHLLARFAKDTFIRTYVDRIPREDLEIYAAENLNPQKTLEEIQDQTIVYFLAERAGQLLGYVKLDLELPPSSVPSRNSMHLARIYVLPEAFGEGVGKMLFETSRKWAISQGRKGLWLCVWKKNQFGYAFHRKCGFREVGSKDFPLAGKFYDDWVMYQELAPVPKMEHTDLRSF